VIKNEKVEPLKELITKVLGPLAESGSGIFFVIDIGDVIGLKPEI
jgi:nitrogen regulatory protein PII